MTATIHHGDCLDVLRQMPDNSVHAIVTDPPYGLSNTTPEQVADTIVRWVSGEREYLPSGKGFMGRSWDAFVPPVAVWDEAMRVLKPGGHVLAFAGTRTMDLMTLGLRLAGFDIRDSVAWLYGSGFPKSMDVGKAIDKLNSKPLGRLREFGAYVRARRESAGLTQAEVNRAMNMPQGCGWWEGKGAGEKWDLHLPSRDTWTRLKSVITTLDSEWDWFIEWAEAERHVIGTRTTGIGTGKGAVSYIGDSDNRDITAPATDAAKQWHGWGSATKPAFEPVIMARKPFRGTLAANVLEHGTGGLNIDACRIQHGSDVDLNARQRQQKSEGGVQFASRGLIGKDIPTYNPSGRWPANVILDEHMAGVLDQQSGVLGVAGNKPESLRTGIADGPTAPRTTQVPTYAGGPSVAYGDKGGASRFFHVIEQDAPFIYCAKAPKKERPNVGGVSHSTVKPLKLMRLLVRLVTPPNGIVLDPFAGSGTTIEAAMLEGFDVIGIEREAEYLPLIQQRIDRAA